METPLGEPPCHSVTFPLSGGTLVQRTNGVRKASPVRGGGGYAAGGVLRRQGGLPEGLPNLPFCPFGASPLLVETEKLPPKPPL